ncbi:MAG: alpha-1,2-fucosyltransferase [Simkaniaceae bacterium]|nr:alpha-1,2-fucosyltransferase [Candidatus Sacchlamyda saccharinae]
MGRLRVFICFCLILGFQPLEAKHKREKPYVVGSLLGQLGNQLFEVATASALAWDNDAEAYFPDFLPYSNEYRHVFFRCNIKPPKKKVTYKWKTEPFGYQPIPFISGMKLSGYFQNEKYFAHYRDRLLKLFSPRLDDLEYIQKKYQWILEHPEAVSVHLRYYRAEKPDDEAFLQYDRAYFEKAMALFPDSCVFIVTSDNIPFARENIPADKGNVFFVENEPYWIDFYLQSLCKHNVISNSTFSWWSAWLNQNPDKIVVRPKDWLAGYPDIGGPDDWIKID